jgi:peptidyl-prolyl cis-trans isomerase D
MYRWKDTLFKQGDRARIIKHGGSYFILAVAMMSMVFFGICDPSGRRGLTSGGGLSGAAATVAGDDVSDLEFRRAYQEIYSRYQRQFQDSFDPAAFELSKMVLNQLVDQRVAVAQARAAGFHASPREVEKVLAEAEVFKDDNGKFSGEQFETYLRRNQYTEASFAEEIRRNIEADKFRGFVQDTYYVPKDAAEWAWRLSSTKYDVDYLKFDPQSVVVQINDSDVTAFLDEKGKEKVKEYYGKNQREFNTAQKVRARHILVAFEGARNATAETKKRSKDEALKLAERVLADVHKPGADFAQLASKFTDEVAGKASGGDLGAFEREAMVKEFADAAFAMKGGEVSKVVESPFGFHIIKVEQVIPATSLSLEEARPRIARKLLERERKPKIIDEQAAKVLEAFKADPSKGDAEAKALGLQWQNTGEFAADARTIPGLGSDSKTREAVLSLTPQIRVYPGILEVSGTKYIVRLKSLSPADPSTLTKEKREELASNQVFTESYAIMNTLRAEAKKGYEKGGKIWINGDFRDLDQTRKRQSQGEGS